MRRTPPPDDSPAPAPARIAPVNAGHLAAFAGHLDGRPANTRAAYLRDAHALAQLAGDADLARLEARELRRFLATLHGRGLTGRSLSRALSSWRCLYRFLLERGVGIAADPCAGLKAPKVAKRLPSALSPDEAVRLVRIPGDDALAVRDRALFELAYSSGLRLAELAGIDVERLDLATGEARVWGKGAKERIVPVGAPAIAAVRAWLAARAGVPNADPKALFVGRSGKRITPRAIERRLAEWAVKQGLGRHVHPHMLRHSFASHLLQSSGDLRAVQEMLGHASIASTQVYTHLDFQYLAKAYDKAHPRAKRRKR
jgi:integrase/recombinase XerC